MNTGRLPPDEEAEGGSLRPRNRAASQARSSPPTLLGQARDHLSAGALAPTIDLLTRFVRRTAHPTADEQKACLELAHESYNRAPSALTDLYEAIFRRGFADYWTIVRICEGWLACGQAARALDFMRRHLQFEDLEAWGHCYAGEAYGQLGDTTLAFKHLRIALGLAPTNPHFLFRLIQLAPADALLDARPTLIAHASRHLAPQDQLLAAIMGRSRLGERPLLTEPRLNHLPTPQAHELHWYIQVFNTLLATGEEDAARQFTELLWPWRLQHRDVTLACLNSLYADARWTDALELIRALPQDQRADDLMRVKTLECLCLSGQVAEARTLLADSPAQPSIDFDRIRLRIHAGMHEWMLCLTALRTSAHTATLLDDPGLASVVVRACRATRRYRTVIALLEAMRVPRTAAQEHLLQVLVEEAHDRRAIPAAMFHRLAPNNTSWTRARTSFKATRTNPRVLTRTAFLFCTNDAYALATCVSVLSLATSNPDIARGCTFYFALERHEERSAAALRALCVKLGITCEFLYPEDFTASLDNLRIDYGLFTSGHQLARAAYYRIYAALHLQAHSRARSLIYVDSDTLVNAGLHELLTFDLNGKPLAARVERKNRDVERASIRHGFKRHRYFNSGILVIDLRHIETKTCLQRAIRICELEPWRLVFHDQCALNIGFENRAAALPERFNTFVLPETADDMVQLAQVLTEPIVHFIDRPKPWDAGYLGLAGAIWFQKYQQLVATVGNELVQELLKQSNHQM